jgi:hypothetical protein
MDGGDLPQARGIFAARRRTLDGCHGCAVFLFGVNSGHFTDNFPDGCRRSALFPVLCLGAFFVVVRDGLLRFVVFIAVGEPKIDHCLAQSASHGALLSFLQ